MRRDLPVAAAFAVTTALLLTACGGQGDGTDRSGALAGADRATPESVPASRSASQPADHRPEITLPNDLSDRFENWKTGDATKDAVLADGRLAQTAMNDAIIEGTPDTPGLTFYYKGEALTSSARWVRKWLDAGITYTGTTRYYSPKVRILGTGSASLTYCADESKAFNRNRKTKQVDRTPAGNDSYVLYDTRLEKNAQGVWQTSEGTSVRGSSTCAR
ncbi:hypothetical protein [Streptomyces sp. NPDC002580]|uniref:hypothetical protein n=1 Tax=Streptomyces sp. NPDC002580 TaxID=3364653 RepID=UPI0036BDC2B4